MAGEYECGLDEASVKKARDELYERSDKDRDTAVQSLREWLLQQKDWLKSPTDYTFLLRFLRVRKFSQLEARDSIEKYWTIKDEARAIFRDMDTTEPFVTEMLKDGVFLCPKTYDKDGCRLLIGRAGYIDLNKMKKRWGRDNVYKMLFILVEWMLMDEKTQIHGFKFLWDMTNLTMAHVTQMAGTSNNTFMAKFQNKAMPARIKGVWHYNEPPFVEAITILFTPFMSKKLRDRMKFFGKNLANVYKHVGECALPGEYLPDDYNGPSAGSEQQIIGLLMIRRGAARRARRVAGKDVRNAAAEHADTADTTDTVNEANPDLHLDSMISELTSPEVRNHIKKISSMEYGVDLKKKPSPGLHESASFRKLNVD